MPKMFEKSFALFKMFLNIKNCLETFQNVAYIMLIQKVLKKCCSKENPNCLQNKFQICSRTFHVVLKILLRERQRKK